MTLTLEDVTQLTGLCVYGEPLSRCTYIDYRHLVERYLGFSPEGDGSIKGVSRSELFSVMGLSGLHGGLEESLTSFCSRVSRHVRGTLVTFEISATDFDLHRFLFLFKEKALFATLGDSLSCRLLFFLSDLDEVRDYSWGVGLLAHLHTSLSTPSMEWLR